MNNYIFNDRNDNKYKRVDKRQARKAYENGANVILCPCNLRPFDSNFPAYFTLNRETIAKTDENATFNFVINQFEFYNCINTETGKYSAFYVAID